MSLVYKGPSDKSDLSTEFHIEDEKGKLHVFHANVPYPQSDKLSDEFRQELLSEEGRAAGHKFEDTSASEQPSDPTTLAGQELNEALKAANLSTSGSADEKRARLAEAQGAATDAGGAAGGGTDRAGART